MLDFGTGGGKGNDSGSPAEGGRGQNKTPWKDPYAKPKVGSDAKQMSGVSPGEGGGHKRGLSNISPGVALCRAAKRVRSGGFTPLRRNPPAESASGESGESDRSVSDSDEIAATQRL